ncbi:hypothetical protein E3J61_00930, partial [Candidatus Dependentiae bacterium]
MKKSIVLSLLFLSMNGLYAMEAGESAGGTFPYNQLPAELDCMVMKKVPQDVFPIAPEDAVQDVAEYAHGNMVNSVAVFPDGQRVVSGG